MQNIQIGKRIVWLDKVSSTNSYTSKLINSIDSDGLVIAARYQTEGKGQRGNTWESSIDDNLTFSILLYPNFLEVQKQFLLSKVASLGVFEAINPLVQGVSIKWPNDIYINNRKVAGILIENSFSTQMLNSTIIGIGLNVNQQVFSDELPNPTSLTIETGNKFDLIHLLSSLCTNLSKRYQQLVNHEWESLSNDYFNCLYRNLEYYQYTAKGKTFSARVVAVRESGELVLETIDGEIKEFGFKEVSFGG